MTVKVLYQTQARAVGGRDGHARILSENLAVMFDVPTELGGHGGLGVNPEKLLALGYSACFLSALRSAAQRENVNLPDGVAVEATVGIGLRSEGGFGLAVAVEADIPGWTRDEAEALVLRAHQNCPYSDALRGKVDLTLSVPEVGGLHP
jgi:Ohr subfamily peroxiredoxin